MALAVLCSAGVSQVQREGVLWMRDFSVTTRAAVARTVRCILMDAVVGLVVVKRRWDVGCLDGT